MIPTTPDPVEIDPGRYDLGVRVRAELLDDDPVITADVHVFMDHDGEEWYDDDGRRRVKDLTFVIRSCTKIVGAWRADKPMRIAALTERQHDDLIEVAQEEALDAWRAGQVGAR